MKSRKGIYVTGPSAGRLNFECNQPVMIVGRDDDNYIIQCADAEPVKLGAGHWMGPGAMVRVPIDAVRSVH